MTEPTPRRRGRPRKFGSPSQVVALTLPRAVLTRLRKIHPDIAWAIVGLVDKGPVGDRTEARRQVDADLVGVAGRRSLIVVNRDIVRNLPGINILQLSGQMGFLALPPGGGIADLEVAVMERLHEGKGDPRELDALAALRSQIKKWRRDPSLRFETQTIIVVERVPPARKKRAP